MKYLEKSLNIINGWLQVKLRERRAYCRVNLMKGVLQRQWLCTEICRRCRMWTAREGRKTLWAEETA